MTRPIFLMNTSCLNPRVCSSLLTQKRCQCSVLRVKARPSCAAGISMLMSTCCLPKNGKLHPKPPHDMPRTQLKGLWIWGVAFGPRVHFQGTNRILRRFGIFVEAKQQNQQPGQKYQKWVVHWSNIWASSVCKLVPDMTTKKGYHVPCILQVLVTWPLVGPRSHARTPELQVLSAWILLLGFKHGHSPTIWRPLKSTWSKKIFQLQIIGPGHLK